MPRLDKLVAHRGGLGRKLARIRVRQGRVTVDGQVQRDPGATVDTDQRLGLDGRELSPAPRLAVFHKPLGVVCTTDDPWGRPSLADAAGDLLAMGLHPVGRLDADTDGLLPFSAQGAWTQHLLHPRHGVEKLYRAAVVGEPDATLAARLAAGIETTAGTFAAQIKSLQANTLTLTVTEGKHRMVRRMLANAGHPVVELRRLGFGPLTLGDLEAGAWRPATAAEQAWVQDRVGRTG